MARRLVLDANGMHYSKPGVDAATASPADLLFDSEHSAFNGVYLVGRLPASAFAQSQSSEIAAGQTVTVVTRTCTLAFGRTFPDVPRVKWGILDNTAGNAAFVSSPFFSTFGSGQGGQLTGSTLRGGVAVSTTQAVFTFIYRHYSGPGFNLSLDVPYIVFEV